MVATRRYVWQGLCEEDLSRQIGVLKLPAASYFVARDVTFDTAETDPDFVDDLMAELGYLPDVKNTIALAPLPFLGLVSPDGNVWQLAVDNLGILTATKVS
jgi:hypothetical protein